MSKIEERANDLINKIKNDKNLKNKFMKNPVKTIDELVDVAITKEELSSLIDTIKAKLSNEEIAKATKEVTNTIKGLFK